MAKPITYVGLDVHKDTIAVALAEKARGQVAGDGGFFADVARAGGSRAEKGVRARQAAEAARGGLRAAVPEAGGDGRGGRGGVGEDGPGEQGEFGEALAGLGGVDELAAGPEHLLGRERAVARPASGRGSSRGPAAASGRAGWRAAAARGGAGRGWRRRRRWGCPASASGPHQGVPDLGAQQARRPRARSRPGRAAWRGAAGPW